MNSTGPESFFKKCTMCGHDWPQRDTFLADPTVKLIGYMPVFKDLESGLLMFNHDCHTTLSLKVGTFIDLVDGPAYSTQLTGTSHCPGHCLRQESVEPCDAHCRCAYVRGMMQVIRAWPKWLAQQDAATG